MPIKRSSIKDVRRTRRRRERNVSVLTRLRSAIKKVREAKTADEARKAYTAAASLLDKAARGKYIHASNAARNKSRLAKVVKAIK